MRRKSEPEDLSQFLPLTPTVFDILLALWECERHGYGIMREVRRESEGRVILRPGTLYRALSRLEDMGFLEESEMRPDPELDDERRRYYRLTGLGKRVLKAEAQRLAHQVHAARAKKLIQGRAG
jgi:DNA-binding PadR family transcriptional regulator